MTNTTKIAIAAATTLATAAGALVGRKAYKTHQAKKAGAAIAHESK
jgi:hypothetical protein